MLKGIAILAVGVAIGAGGAYLGLRTETLQRTQVWQVVPKAKVAAAGIKDDVDCFPQQSLVSDDQRRLVKDNASTILADLPEGSRVAVANLLRDDAPLPYTGQRAVRSAAILHSLDRYRQCLAGGGESCDKGDAAHLFVPAVQASDRPEVDAAFKAGSWREHLRADIAAADFCTQVWKAVPRG